MSVDLLISEFLSKNDLGIKTMFNLYFPQANNNFINDMKKSLADQLKCTLLSSLNKEDNLTFEDLYSDLFYSSNDFLKKASTPIIKKISNKNYLCPGCLFFNKKNIIPFYNGMFKCKNCENELKSSTDPKIIAFFRTFFIHNKSGYSCNECNRFIPHPIDDAPVISCPYTDCIFVGSWGSLKRMNHPILKNNKNDLSLVNDDLFDKKINEILSEDEKNKFSILKYVIDCQKNSLYYGNSTFTLKLKYLCYEAFSNILNKYPKKMTNYLLENSRSGGFQCKIFQEYSKLLELEMPFSIKKNHNHHMIESLLDKNLTLFDGISSFEEIVSDKLEIKNNTDEFYIGGRKGSISKPYFIGKLLNISDKNSKAILLDKVIEYNFSKIYLKDVKPGTEVIVTHLRAPPHYQMGGMAYINKIRKNIIDESLKLF